METDGLARDNAFICLPHFFPRVYYFHCMDNPVACYAAGISLPHGKMDSSCSSLRDTPVGALHHYQKLNKTRSKSDSKATSLKHLQLHETYQVIAIYFTGTVFTPRHPS